MVYRKDGSIRFDKQGTWSYQDADDLIRLLLSPRNMAILRERLSVDFAISVDNLRIRVNIFNTDGGPSLAMRLLPNTIPTIEHLNMHPSLESISELKAGLVLICGATGSGKTTTIASILDNINHKRAAHIISLEDPIEFRIPSRQSFVEQREVGTHVRSFEHGLIDVMREDPDIIMVGELRDPQTIALTLNAAESGHLVIATMHATNMEDALYRIINSATPEAEEYVRYQVASTLSWVIVQKLILNEKAGFRLPLLSIMRGTNQIKGIIRDKKLFQLENAVHVGKTEGMFSQERYLTEFLEKREKYFNPAMSFKPPKDVVTHSSYSSPMFDSGYDAPAKTETAREQSFGGRFQSSSGQFKTSENDLSLDVKTTPSLDFDESQYVISEIYDLKEIIAETENG